MASLTRTNLRRRMGSESRAMLIGDATSAGLSDGSTTVDNARFRDYQVSPRALTNALMLFTAGTGVIGNVRRIREYDNTNGVITLTPPAGAQVPSGADFEVWLLPVLDTGACDGTRKALVHQAIDDGIARSVYKWRHYLTLVTDGDMELSGVTNWTAGGGATLTKSTTTVGEGRRSLRVQNAAINEYADSANIAVLEDETYYVEASVFVTTGIPNLIVRNVTASSTISTEKLADSDQLSYTQTNAWVRLWTTVDVPAGCDQISIRLAGEEGNADIYWENIVVWRINGMRSTLPAWVTNPNRLLYIETRPLGDRYGREQWTRYGVSPESFIQSPAGTPNELQHPAFSRIVAVVGERPYDALTDITATFAANEANTVVGDEDHILAICMVELYDKLMGTVGSMAYAQKRAEWASRMSHLSAIRRERSRGPAVSESVSFRSSYWR